MDKGEPLYYPIFHYSLSQYSGFKTTDKQKDFFIHYLNHPLTAQLNNKTTQGAIAARQLSSPAVPQA